jgi:hypothetical protein
VKTKRAFDKLNFKDYEIMNWLKRSTSQTLNKWATKSSLQNYWCKKHHLQLEQCWVVLWFCWEPLDMGLFLIKKNQRPFLPTPRLGHVWRFIIL